MSISSATSSYFAPVLKDPFTVDYDQINARAQKVARVGLAVLLVFPLIHWYVPVHLINAVSWVVTGLYLAVLYGKPQLEVAWSARAADENAVTEYLDADKPDERARERIAYSVRAAELYLLRAGDPNKKDEKGKFLVESNAPSEKLMIRHGFDLSTCRFDLACRNIRKLVKESVLKVEDLAPKMFTRDEQSQLWLRSEDNCRWLKEHGHDVNVRGKYGLTPLHVECWASQPDFGRIQLLLELGADPYIRNWLFRNAWGVTENPEVHALLDKYKK